MEGHFPRPAQRWSQGGLPGGSDGRAEILKVGGGRDGKFAGVGRGERPDVGRGRVQAGRSGPAQPILRQNLRRTGKETAGEAQAR